MITYNDLINRITIFDLLDQVTPFPIRR
jgi:hypothetical protein